jgi:membrane-bound lytic murein transglycosylase D
MLIRLSFILFLILSALRGESQRSFVQSQETILALSENQWICRELKSVNKTHFDCDNNANTWNFPDTDSLKFGHQVVLVSETDREIFRELLFPDGSCGRYLTLVSLCDLYFPLFRKKVEDVGLDSDFKYLPLLLSGINQGFKSNDHSGMWAMDYLVARKVHLRIDSLIDERNGGDFTTSAAFQYLKELNEKYEGDIVKTIAAYRLGIPSMLKIAGENTQTTIELLPDFEKKSIQFLAYIKTLIESTRAQNQLQNYFDVFALYEGVVMEKDSKLEAMKQVMDLNVSNAKDVNPVFVGSKIPAMYRKVPFMMPVGKAGSWKLLKDTIANWQPARPEIPADTAPTVVYHIVKRGESLGSIAKKHRTTVRKIKSLNKLKSDKIRQGQRLIVSQNSNQKSLAEKGDPAPEINVKPDAETKPKKKKQEEKTITYKVKSGDSLWKIANKYKGVTAEDIKRWNKCGDNLKPGQKLIIHLDK